MTDLGNPSLVEEQTPCSANEIEVGFRLATLWNLETTRRRVERAYEVKGLSPWEAIRIGRTARKVEWIVEGYAYMLYSTDPPSLDDAEALGLDNFVNLMTLRDEQKVLRHSRRSKGLHNYGSKMEYKPYWFSRKRYHPLQKTDPTLVARLEEIFRADLLEAQRNQEVILKLMPVRELNIWAHICIRRPASPCPGCDELCPTRRAT